MCKIPSGARFIIAGKKGSDKQLSKPVTSAFKLWFSQRDAYHVKIYYFSGAKTFWGIQSKSLVLEWINKINKRRKWKTNKYIQFFFAMYNDTSW